MIYKESMPVDRDGILTTVIILFCTVILFVGLLIASKWQMNAKLGGGLFGIYLAFVTYRIVAASTGTA